MLAVATVFIVAVLSLLVTRIATLALTLTGLSSEAARFQARSALTGTGFTTNEAEAVVSHPVRRRIVMTLMLLGGVGLVTAIATLIIGFANASRAEAFGRLMILGAGLSVLLLIARTRWFNRALGPLLVRLLNRYADFETQDYAELLRLGGEWGVGEVSVREGDWLACERLVDLDLRPEGVAILGIERADGTYLGAPGFDTEVQPGDVLLLYGRRERLAELDDRPAGPDGDRAHERAIAEQREQARSEREEDERREAREEVDSAAAGGSQEEAEMLPVEMEDSVRRALALRNWAVVGLSPDPERDSNRIARLLDAKGYRVIPVNPSVEEVLGRRSYPDLHSAAAENQIDVVDIFRHSEHAGEHVREAIETGAEAVWMQLGVIDPEAAGEAERAGLRVVVDRCPAIEIPRLGIEGPETTVET